jgi:hypothetical protein
MRARLLASAFAFLLAGTIPALAWTDPQCSTDDFGPMCFTATDLHPGGNGTGRATRLGIVAFDGSFALTLFNDEWKLPVRSDLPVLLRVDGGQAVQRAGSTRNGTIAITLEADDIGPLMDGSKLFLELPGASNSYSLKGSQRAIGNLVKAFAVYRRGGAPVGGNLPAPIPS